MKNTNAIDKIIKELSCRDFEAQKKRLLKQKYGQRAYLLSVETLDAIHIKRAYLTDEIDEETYKGWCLAYNLRTRGK